MVWLSAGRGDEDMRCGGNEGLAVAVLDCGRDVVAGTFDVLGWDRLGCGDCDGFAFICVVGGVAVVFDAAWSHIQRCL